MHSRLISTSGSGLNMQHILKTLSCISVANFSEIGQSADELSSRHDHFEMAAVRYLAFRQKCITTIRCIQGPIFSLTYQIWCVRFNLLLLKLVILSLCKTGRHSNAIFAS